jgi:hypothetical protein
VKPVPSLSEWRELWASWDAVTRQMIPKEALNSKPIKLRNECIFYLGHIPTFTLPGAQMGSHLYLGTFGGSLSVA